MYARTKLYTTLYVAIFAYFGVLARVGMTALSKAAPAGSVLLPLLGVEYFLPNVVGSILLGMLSASSSDWSPSCAPIIRGVSVGFCGSCTTFATWQLVVAIESLHGDWLDALIIRSWITTATSFVAYLTGRHIGLTIIHWTLHWWSDVLIRLEIMARQNEEEEGEEEQEEQEKEEEKPEQSEKLTERSPIRSTSVRPEKAVPTYGSTEIADIMNSTEIEETMEVRRKSTVVIVPEKYKPSWSLVLVATALLVACTATVWLLVAFDVNRRCWWVTVAFGPLGAVMRFGMSSWNRHYPTFPLMTFAANTIAVCTNIHIVVLHNYLEDSTSVSDSVVAAYALWVGCGLSTGAMGSLSTVSTWIAELHRLDIHHAYVYAVSSILAAQTCVMSIGVFWKLWGNQLVIF